MSAATASLGIANIGQISIIVKDVERATAFYRDVLGLPLLFEAGGMLFFDLAGTRLLIGTENSAGAPGGSVLYFEAPDIDGLAPALEAKGVRFPGPSQVVQRTETHELKLREFRDPDGNVLALLGMVPRQAAA